MNTRSESTLSNHPLHPLSITGRLIWTLLLFLVISSTLTYYQFQQGIQQATRQQLDSLGNGSSSHLALSTGPMVLSEDWLSLNYSLKQLTEDPLIRGVEVLDRKGGMLAQSGQPSDWSYDAPVKSNQDLIAHVRLYLDPAPLQQQVQPPLGRLLAMQAAIGLALLLLVGAYCWRLRQDLNRLKSAANALQHNDHIPLLPARRDELGEIAGLLNLRFADQPDPVAMPTATDMPGEVEDETPAPITEYAVAETDDEYGETTLAAEFTPESVVADSTAALDEPVWSASDAGDALPLETVEATPPRDDHYLLYINQHSTESDYLSVEERDELLDIYRSVFNRACDLYQGRRDEDAQGNWYALFSRNQEADGVQGVNALCAAQLFRGLYRGINQRRIGQMQPVLNLKICLCSGEQPPLEQAQVLSGSVESNELITQQSIFDNEILTQRLLEGGQFTKVGGQTYLLSALCPDFQELIDRQADHFIERL